MPVYTQVKRPIAVTTPLGPDVLLLQAVSGTESLSGLFSFRLELLAESETEIPFEKVLGQSATVSFLTADGDERYINGILSRFSQGRRVPSGLGPGFLTCYYAELVPRAWLLTRRTQSRIFQQMTVPEILKQVLTGLDAAYQLQGTYKARDYCVQYRESDFAFASRLMEEEGIYYFFQHEPGGHKMVVGDTPQSHDDVPGDPALIFEEVRGGLREEDRIFSWEKTQELRSAKVTLWDHCFELPGQNLEAVKSTVDSVQAGRVAHKLKLPANDPLELYDYPGAYAQRFDGISPGGGDRAGDVQNIFEDNGRTAGIRMQQEAARALLIRGKSTCPQLIAGYKFSLTRHFNGDGAYVITGVSHAASMGDAYVSASDAPPSYENSFQCIPAALPFRPERTTPRPTVEGTQTAVVVGNAGDEIFTDKYGRVKVQFPWDRHGKRDADSSCWIRVATPWAGKQWGMVHIPRVGQEVVVAFEEGDPDRPIIVGSVYNADQMPPYALPANMTQSGIKSRSSKGGSGANFNEIRLEDKKGSELLSIHAEKDQSISVENDESHTVGHDRSKTIDHDETTHVKHDRTETVDNNETITIGVNRVEKVGANETIAIGANRTETVGSNESITVTLTRTRMVGVNESINVGAAQEITVGGLRAVTVGAAQTITVGAAQAVTVGGGQTESFGGKHTQTVGKTQTVTVGSDGSYTIGGKRDTSVGKDDNLNVKNKLTVEAGDEIILKTGSASITLKSGGTIEIKGTSITIEGSTKIEEKAPNITSDASAKNLVKGAMVNAEASGINTIKGSLVKIN
ncbi:Phage-related baseplate assembly protein [Aquisphaera giovannonii]|uniref:Phage-related baseplate assembly protein n=1 Tax=Aquisphaera giovannonii TaxID=406548 RepID=A0A5B9VZF5_9BACT|nr:type VI secretion system tip protein VgrG [Aquisphaera giovannonii]QEH33324.1 Phage-related baseplate assembly protein [Aquisphaera giovannonii]